MGNQNVGDVTEFIETEAVPKNRLTAVSNGIEAKAAHRSFLPRWRMPNQGLEARL